MAAVTQQTPTFLGGVSRQVDDKKISGQVVDSINSYPDPTYGLVKRSSAAYLFDLRRPYSDRPFEEGELADAFWFTAEAQLEVTEQNKDNYPTMKVGDVFTQVYMAAIHGGQVYLWNSLTGESQPVFNSGTPYLERPDGTFYGAGDFHARTVRDSVIICNRNVKTEMVPYDGEEFYEDCVATIRLNAVLGETKYRWRIDDKEYEITPNAEATAADVLQGIVDQIPEKYNPRRYKTSVEMYTDGIPFTVSVDDTNAYRLLNSYQDTVDNPSLLASPSKTKRLVRVTNDPEDEGDGYYLEWDKGSWQETVGPEVDVEPDARTMPHRLYVDEKGVWRFAPVNYTDRLVGNDDSNPVPSFIGETINASFYYNNRLGFLSGANVILSQAKDVFNFFGISQLTISDADPIDLNANSTKAVELHEVVTQASGVLLFGTRQQFWLSAPETGILTPTRSVVTAVSNYESDKDIAPLDLGTSIGFVSKSPDYSKLMLMAGQGSDQDPTVVDISKVVTGWLPNTINRMAVSSQNSLVVLTGKDDEYVYLYKFYNDGNEDRMQSWCRWKMLGPVQMAGIFRDTVFILIKQSNRYSVVWIGLNSLSKGEAQLSDDEFKPGGPNLDYRSAPKSVVYEDDYTKFYTKFPLVENESPRMVLTLPNETYRLIGGDINDVYSTLRQLPRTTDDDPGFWAECEQGTDDDGNYFMIKGDFKQYEDAIQIGYAYEYDITLPKFYFKNGDMVDYTASLIINRAKFSVGLTGGVTFKIKANGRDEWVDIQHVTDANYYDADTDPLQSEQLFTVPINQRNKNFQLRVTSDLPFPVSLVSMMWEGQYTPRFYQRG